MTEKAKESITPEELKKHRELQVNVALMKSEAERAVALNKLAETESANFVLQLYMKYGLRLQHDRITETGEIQRGVTTPNVKPAPAPAPVVDEEKKTKRVAKPKKEA